jgi:hypothetical protein
MPGMTRPATARPQEDPLLSRPRQAAFLTAGVVALTAVVFALAAGHGTLARIQRLDDAWLRLAMAPKSTKRRSPGEGSVWPYREKNGTERWAIGHPKIGTRRRGAAAPR